MGRAIIGVLGGAEIVVGALVNIFTQWPTWISWLLVATGILFVVLELAHLWRQTKTAIRPRLSRGPVAWDYTNYIGGGRSGDEPPYIACFQVRGIAKIDSPLSDCHIRSQLTGEVIPVGIKTRDAYVDPSRANVPKGATIYAHGLFYDPMKERGPNEREGIVANAFLSNWGDFKFVYRRGKKGYERHFSYKENKKRIEEMFFPQIRPKPRVTGKLDILS